MPMTRDTQKRVTGMKKKIKKKIHLLTDGPPQPANAIFTYNLYDGLSSKGYGPLSVWIKLFFIY